MKLANLNVNVVSATNGGQQPENFSTPQDPVENFILGAKPVTKKPVIPEGEKQGRWR